MKAATQIPQRQGHHFLYPPRLFQAWTGERGLAMKDRPWSTKNNPLAEDLTKGQGEGWGREQERREEKK